MQVFKPGSTSPATQLWDARALLDAGSARCDKLLRTLAEQLPAAVATCVQAAGVTEGEGEESSRCDRGRGGGRQDRKEE